MKEREFNLFLAINYVLTRQAEAKQNQQGVVDCRETNEKDSVVAITQGLVGGSGTKNQKQKIS